VARPGVGTRSALWRYGFSVLAVGVATILMVGWRQVFPGSPAVAPFLAAILLTGWYVGGVPVVLATALSVLVFLLLSPASFLELSWPLVARLVWFLAFAGLAAWFGAARRTAAEGLERARAELEGRVLARTTELRRSEEYLLAAQQLSHTGSWAWRIATGDITWSEEGARILGLDPAGRTFSRQRLDHIWHPDDRKRAGEAIDAALREKRSYGLHVRIVRPDGSTRYVRCFGRPVFGEAGEIVEYVGILMDVTERKRAARRLRRAREQAADARFAAMLDERTRIARELHDTLLQGFTGVGLRLVAVTNRMEGPPEAVAALRDVIALAQGTLENARRAIWDIRPAPSAGRDLAAMLRAAAEEWVCGTDVSLEFAVEGSVRPANPDVDTAVFRVMQEAIANVVKHAAARTVRVVLAYEPTRIRLAVTDDGRGFIVDPDFRAYGGHLGLLGMRERASQAHGTLTVRSSPGHGTEIVLLVAYATREAPSSGPET
jgi:PAS domain S-box-containing protein